MQRRVELRNLPASSLDKLAEILEINNDWMKVMDRIPKNLQSDQFERKYNSEDITKFKEYAAKTNQHCAQVLFDEWGTSGRVRPTLDTVMKILQEAEMYRAVVEVARILGEPPPPRPEKGPAAPITCDMSLLLNESSKQTLNNTDYINSSRFNPSSKHSAICHQPTKKLQSSINLMEFPPTECIVTPSIGQQAQINNVLPAPVNSEELPRLDLLMGKENDNMTNHNKTTLPSSTIPTDSESSINTNKMSYGGYGEYVPGGYQTSVPNMDIFIIDNGILTDEKLLQFEYRELEMITNKFSETYNEEPNGPSGKIGSGGFGDVYVGKHEAHGILAVKKVRFENCNSSDLTTLFKLFNAEVKSLSHLRHENIVPILGYSIDGPTPCVICEYIAGGSLQQKIEAKVLDEQQRINIIRGTAVGLKYIHHSELPPQNNDTGSEIDLQSSKKSYYLHGDVKSANILLTKDCIPKLCDFGLAKGLDNTFVTKSMMGTSAYMAPEGFQGTVTQKNDIYSFGIVLLELLTGLKPIITANGESNNIKDYVEENCPNDDITILLDPVVNKWTRAETIYKLAKHCLKHNKSKRPTIDHVYDVINGIVN